MNYIKRSLEGIRVYGDETKILTKGLKQYLNELCMENLSTYQGRIDAARRITGSNNLVPLYISNDILFFPTKSIREYECIFVNLFNVLTIKNIGCGESRIIFKDLSELETRISFRKLKNQVNKSRNLMNKKKMFSYCGY